jgi:hypothetical protein
VPSAQGGYLLVRLDSRSDMLEVSETNNTAALAVSQAAPDLAVTNFALVSSGGAGVTLAWTERNDGAASAAGAWRDAVYWSSNAVWSAQATLLWELSFSSPSVAPGGSVRRTNTVPVPSAQGGYLLVRLDSRSDMLEVSETNNTAALAVSQAAPDLLASGLSWSGQPVAGQALTVVWTVANLGGATVQPNWYDALYFSTNAVWDGKDAQLCWQNRNLALAAGGSYQVTNTVTIPANTPPGYYLVVKTDAQNAVFEADEANNWQAFGVGLYRDADGNGLPDWWEIQYFGTNGINPNADPDGDGFQTKQEFIADTNPTNKLSYLHISGVTEVRGGVKIDWQGGIWATQELQRAVGLVDANGWMTIMTTNPPTSISNSYVDTLNTNAMRFYRIGVTR